MFFCVLNRYAVPFQIINRRLICTSSSLKCYKGIPEDNALKKYIRQNNLSSEDIYSLTEQDHGDLEDSSLSQADHISHNMKNIDNQETYRWKKIIIKKYFKDLYKIKPGEIYNKSKDPFFKDNKTSDFNHSHHQYYKKTNKPNNSIDELNDSNLQNSESPLNPFYQVNKMYKEKPYSKYSRDVKAFSSPEESYYSQNPVSYRNTSQSNSIMNNDSTFEDTLPPSIVAPADDNTAYGAFATYEGPCLLLWSMKEQMRYLHHIAPQQWTTNALSLIFPISPKNVKKLLDSKYRPVDEAAIAQHDSAVMKRWANLSNGAITSEALAKKIVSRGSWSEQSNVPAITQTNQEMMEFMDKLIFEQPDGAVNMGVSRSAPDERVAKRERHVFVDILNSYQSQLKDIKNPQDQSTSSLEMANIDEIIPEPSHFDQDEMVRISCSSNSKNTQTSIKNIKKKSIKFNKFGSKNEQKPISRKIITYDDFMKQKELNLSSK